jgi:hypothetical protein
VTEHLAYARDGEKGLPIRQENNMVDFSISGRNLVLQVRGADKLWAFKSSLEIPLAHINEIRADPAIAHGWWHGIRMPGTNIPGVLTAGTFYQDGKRVFWDVHNPENTVVIDLKDERYNELIVEVADPQAAVELVRAALPR